MCNMCEYPKREYTHTEGCYHFGWYQRTSDAPKIKWMRLTDEAHKRNFWFLYPTVAIFDRWNFEKIADKRYEEIDNFSENWRVSFFHYMYYCTLGKPESFKTIINWIMGPIANILNEWEVDSEYLPRILPPSELSKFYDLTQKSGFIKSKSKDALHDICHGFDLGYIEKCDTYWTKDDGELDNIIEAVFTENSDKITEGNPEKIGNWLVGQVMKKTKGKSDPAKVQEKIKFKLQ